MRMDVLCSRYCVSLVFDMNRSIIYIAVSMLYQLVAFSWPPFVFCILYGLFPDAIQFF